MKCKVFAAVIAIAIPVAARAGDSGPELALRTGFSLPFGNIVGTQGGSFSDSFHGFVPLGVEAGWRFTPQFYAGLAFTYAFGFPNNCPSGDSCSGHTAGLGFDVRYHVLPGETIDPWFGIGAGYEWLSLSQTSGGSTVDAGTNGFEFIHIDFGTEFVASQNLRVSPFLQLGLGQYRNADASSGGSSVSGEITDKSLHEFLTFGFRLSFLP